jgi:hypothetical protein
MRKSLDMDAELGARLESLRQQEIAQVFVGKRAVAKENVIKDVMAASVDATKLRERGQEELRADGNKRYPSMWRDVKLGAVSSIGWDEKREEAFCSASSYVSGIESADLFFKTLDGGNAAPSRGSEEGARGIPGRWGEVDLGSLH